ncbi:hypothetical protein MOU94_004581 [Vibrio parahaemolyticus]|nr:hypothetical protein [Vibrio parahaemolyticus]
MLSTEPEKDEITFKTKTLHYRRAQIFNYDGAYNLEELLTRALAKTPKVGQRYLEIFSDDTDSEDDGEDVIKSKLFINHHTKLWGIQFCDLLKYTDNTNMNVVTVDTSAEYLDVEQVAPTDTDDGKKREFLDSIMYLGVFKNHLAVIQSATLRTRDLENYLNWYLQKAGVLDEGRVLLSTEVPTELQEKIAANDTKSIKIGTPLVDTVNNEPLASVKELETFDTKSVSFTPKGRGLDMLLGAFGSNELLEKFGIDTNLLVQDAVDGSDIQVSLELTYKRKASANSKKILNSVTTAMRHAHPDDVVVEIDQVGKLTGKELNIRKNLSVRYYNGVIDPEDLYLKIRNWMKDQIELDEIEAEDS